MRFLFLLLMTTPAWAQVTVQEYPVPKGHTIHDVWADAAPNGPVYFSAQGSGHLGILDPKSGKVEFVALGRGSSPHGVIAGPDGAVCSPMAARTRSCESIRASSPRRAP